MTRALAALVVALAGASAVAAPRPAATTVATSSPLHESPEQTLQRAADAYRRRDWDAAERLLRTLLEPTPQLSSDDELRARKLLALTCFFAYRIRDAEAEFATLLQLKPSFLLDEVSDPPDARAFFEEVRRRGREKVEQMTEVQRLERERDEEKRRREEAERRVRVKPVIVEKPVERRWLALAFAPLGVGQFQNREPKKGWVLLGTQLAFGLSSLAMWSYLEIAYSNGSTKVPLAEQDTARNLSYASLVMGALFWIDVGVGIVDALIHYRGSVSIVPAATPGGAGLSLQGAF